MTPDEAWPTPAEQAQAEEQSYERHEGSPANSGLRTPLLQGSSGIPVEDVESHEQDEQLEAPEDVTIQRLINEVPQNVVSWLKGYGIQKVGEMQVSSETALSFQLNSGIFLTMGMDEAMTPPQGPDDQPAWKRMWRGLLYTRRWRRGWKWLLPGSQTHEPNPGGASVGGAAGEPNNKRIVHGWESSHRLKASILTLKHAAAIGEKGILTYILKRTRAGVTDVSSYELKPIRAVIFFKWRMYGRHVILWQLGIYSVWLGGFCGFVAMWLETEGLNPAWCDGSGGCWKLTAALWSMGLSTVASLPFLVWKVCSSLSYHDTWETMWSIPSMLDYATLALQYMIAGIVATIGSAGLDKASLPWFLDIDLMVSFQSLLLWINLSKFLRGFKVGRFDPLELTRTMVWEARSLLLFFMITIVAFAQAYTCVFQQHDESDVDFDSIWHSWLSLFLIQGGLSVDLKAMYFSHHPVYTVLLFVTFHLMVSIILLNILLAVIVQTFDQVNQLGHCHIIRRRAELLDEIDHILELLGLYKSTWNPAYLHILEMIPNSEENTLSTAAGLSMPLYQRHKHLQARIDEGTQAVIEKLNELQLELQKQGMTSRDKEERSPCPGPSFADVVERAMRRLASDARSRVAQGRAESNPCTATAADDGQHLGGRAGRSASASQRLGWLAAVRAMNSAGRPQRHLG